MSPALRKPPKEVIVTAGPFIGMRDSLDPGAGSPELATLLQNVYPIESFGVSALAGRPGFQTSGLVALGGGGIVQLITQFTKLDGTEYTVAIVGGKFYTFDWNLRTWTEVVTAANFATATITLSSTAKCSAVTFANKLVVSDGVNLAWTWDGTSGAGGLTKLANAPVFYGPITVYYAKLFGIKSTDRKTIVWSEENDPTTGYEVGFANVWSLIQSNANSLTALCGTNEALYYFRARSIGAITGPVTSTFKTDGTREGVDETIGTVSPWAIVERNRRVYFIDADGRPFVIMPGLGAVPVWSDLRETIRSISRTTLSTAQAVDYGPAGLVLLGVTLSSDIIPSMLLAMNPHSTPPRPVALWTGWTSRSLAMVKNGSGNPVMMHGADDGWVYDHGNPEDNLWSDGFTSGAVPITHQAVTCAMGYDQMRGVTYDRLDMVFRTPIPETGVTVSYETPRQTSAPLTVGLTTASAQWDLAVFDTDSWPVSAPESHLAVGVVAAEARWIRVTVAHQTIGEQFGLMTVAARGRFASTSPTLP